MCQTSYTFSSVMLFCSVYKYIKEFSATHLGNAKAWYSKNQRVLCYSCAITMSICLSTAQIDTW